MAMVVGAIANGGELMAPVLVDEVRKPDGSVIKTNRPQVLGTPVDRQLAGIIREMMVSVVKDGTGKAAAIKGVEVAGKTGSAENPHGQPHAWFIGFAPADSPRVAVAVIIENGGAGGKQAAPVAREIMKSVIGQKR
jgi:peptidoglycan glycosyltransferase